MESTLTPFTPWTAEQIQERIAALPHLATEVLRDLMECLSEGWQDIPETMQAYYHAARLELEQRQRIGKAPLGTVGPTHSP